MDLKKLPPKVYGYGAIIVVLIGAFFYFFVGTEARLSVKNKNLNQQEVLNRAEANNLSIFFESLGNSMAVLANIDSVKSPSMVTQSDMDNFVAKKAVGILGGVILTDTKGVVIYNSNTNKSPDVGVSVEDRDYFSWAKSQASEGKYFVGKPIVSRLGGSKGQSIVVVASSVFNGNSFRGLVGASVELDSLTQKYLNVLQVSDSTDVYLIDDKGTILYNNFNPGTVGSNIVGISPSFSKRERVEVADIDKRTFLKLIGTAGISFLIFSVLGRRIDSFLFGGGSSSSNNVSSGFAPGVSSNGGNITDGYKITEIDDGLVSYYGFTNQNGSWLIMKEDTQTSSFRYAKGAKDFAGNWKSRQDLRYDYYYNLF